MGFVELLLTAVGLSADAFSVAVCKGLACGRKNRTGLALLCGLWFGFFQFLMPLIGVFLGSRFIQYIAKYDHWVAFCLLAGIGANMIRESLKGGEEQLDSRTDPGTMLLLAIATSIDAMAVGLGLGLLGVSIFTSAVFIGVCTFILSAAGVLLGSKVGERFSGRAQIAGGVILIILGLRILISHLMGA
ncbi:MAG: manganese efflux pump [Lachnospiraceae bacterium]|nr:manganese efflux pump [Lachnospiraceae bacterium]